MSHQSQSIAPYIISTLNFLYRPEADIPVDHTTVISPDDLQLQKRLEELKKLDPEASTSQPVTDLDLKERLAKLQDRPFVEEKPNRDIFHIDQRSEQEKVNDLVEQYSHETALDRARDPVKDLEERLNKLRGIDGPSGRAEGSSASTAVPADEEDADKQYVKRVSGNCSSLHSKSRECHVRFTFRFLPKRCWTPN